ncbi:MAG TPA: hypothetical protein PLX02_13340, partial [Syntrophorhabdaceae bacterium]|nr:hypothetical protein [Syntrophorhabdaceae bacterium]
PLCSQKRVITVPSPLPFAGEGQGEGELTLIPGRLHSLTFCDMLIKFQNKKEDRMPSLSKKTDAKRARKRVNQGKARKKKMSKASTPAFPIHVEKK